MKKIFSLVLIALIFKSSPLVAMEGDTVHLEHIDSVEKLRTLKLRYPVLLDHETSCNDQGFNPLPEEKELTPIATSILKEYPVQGMWIIINKGQDDDVHAIGRLNLAVRGEEVHMTSWLHPTYRNKGLGKEAHSLLFKETTPYLGQTIKCLKLIIVSDPEPRYAFQEKSVKFDGIFLDILPDNYASLIAYLRAGSSIVGYRTATEQISGISHKFISSLKLHYPIKEISQETLDKDPILKILKEDVEPGIIKRETRKAAIEQLKKIKDGPF